jgi:hypothetical protein
MKVTCQNCKRRIKIKRSKDQSCICGFTPVLFSKESTMRSFREHRMDIIKKLAFDFIDGSSIEIKEEIVQTIIEAVHSEDTRLPAMLTAIQILRTFKGSSHIDLAKLIVLNYPYNPDLRKMLANSLAMSDSRIDHLEGFKQRIIAADLRYRAARNRGDITEGNRLEIVESYQEVVQAHKKFLEGIEIFPNSTVRKNVRDMIEAGPQIAPLIFELEQLHIRMGIGKQGDVKTALRIVMDTNSITNKEVWKTLADPSIGLISPEEVLIELSNWRHFEKIPVEMERIIFLPVQIQIPEEIMRIRSPKREKEVSECDRKVATLALQERADLVVSSDCDLLGSGLQYISEKYWGKEIQVVPPGSLAKWLAKNHDRTVGVAMQA